MVCAFLLLKPNCWYYFKMLRVYTPVINDLFMITDKVGATNAFGALRTEMCFWKTLMKNLFAFCFVCLCPVCQINLAYLGFWQISSLLDYLVEFWFSK